MKSEPLISIVMNCYNGERFLRESLDSIINQTFKNWELIFWDNKSKDKSRKIFLDYKDNRFRYFLEKKFTNLYTARNIALKKTKGDIMTFIDVDDLWLPQKLEEQLKYFKRNKQAEILYSNYYVQKKVLGINYKKIKFPGYLPHGRITKKLLMNYKIGWLTVAIKRGLIKNKSKLFNEKLNMVADFDLMIRLSKKKNIYCIQKPLAIYRHHKYQLTRMNFITQADHFLKWSKSLNLKKIFNDSEKFKIVNNKIKFFKEIILIDKRQYSFQRIYKILSKGEIKLGFKIIIFFLFPNFFTKYILSI